MSRSGTMRDDLDTLRNALANLQPGSAHQAQIPPTPASIFAPARHANALNPNRSLVFGNRGVGKSFWSSVLTHSASRVAVAKYYPRLQLNRIEGVLGFHEDAGKDEGPSPSPAMLSQLLERGFDAEDVWRSVLLQALRYKLPEPLPKSLQDIILWNKSNIEHSELLLRQADQKFRDAGKIFLLVFDALDRLGKDWSTINTLTEGLLRFALDVRGYRALKVKIFMRTDQSKDDALFRFADASKIRSDAVDLAWDREELFGLMYKGLLAEPSTRNALIAVVGRKKSTDFANELLGSVSVQEDAFYKIAGEFMGAGAKRGRTYTWIYDHLADAFGETSPRSFITAVQKAASYRPAPIDTVIDHNGIRAGVQDASLVRVRQLKEDYDWIDAVLKALHGLEVPCDPVIFKKRWLERGTVKQMRAASIELSRLLPLELEKPLSGQEDALLKALRNIGVLEFRAADRINMPDIFRVEAGIKRRGGVRPPTMRRA